MIETFFGLDTLHSARAFAAALLIGLTFGFSLERAGFGSSRRLSGIFYFRDMAVLKVMFTAVITAMLGLSYFLGFGWLRPESVYAMPTIYGAQIIGGLIFGIGFVMSGWCPGTGTVGLASGKLDALVFLVGAVVGSILFNELYPLVKSLHTLGQRGVLLAYENLGMSRATFAFGFTLIAVCCFWLSEGIEKLVSDTGSCLKGPFLKSFSVALLILAGGLFIFPASPEPAVSSAPGETEDEAQHRSESILMAAVEEAYDHIEPEELADRLMTGETDLLVVDVRSVQEYERFHIRGALNIPIPRLAERLDPYRNQGLIVLYSNGMTHPAQARDSLSRLGYENVYILTDGLAGFIQRCLKPISIRNEPLSGDLAVRVNAWRKYFYGLD
jgi:thiosulfate/3-mercaptopyruvate sulfurtransferase